MKKNAIIDARVGKVRHAFPGISCSLAVMRWRVGNRGEFVAIFLWVRIVFSFIRVEHFEGGAQHLIFYIHLIL